MLILGIESASDQCGCALAAEDDVLAETRLALPRRHAEALAPQMRFVCEQAGVALADIEAVAVDHGPGLYTGLRAGLATAKATAAAPAAARSSGPGTASPSRLPSRRRPIWWHPTRWPPTCRQRPRAASPIWPVGLPAATAIRPRPAT